MPVLYQVFIDGTTIFVDMGTPKEEIRSFLYCITFAQATARVKSRSVTAPEYFGELTAELNRLGWRHSNVGRGDLSETLSNSSIADALIPMIQPVMADEWDLKKVFMVWQSREESDTLKFWWDHVSLDQTFELGFGSFLIKNNVPTSRILTMSIRNTAECDNTDEWLCFFKKYPKLQLSFSYYNLTLVGDASVYVPLLPRLEARIGDKITDHVRIERMSYDEPSPDIAPVSLVSLTEGC